MKRPFLLIVLLLAVLFVSSQGQLKIMQYNLLYYDKVIYDCDTNNNNVDEKNQYLRTILSYVKPDIFCVNEINASDASVQYLEDNVLNTRERYWSHAFVTDSFTSSMVFYDSRKVVLKSQSYIASQPRQIQIYNMSIANDSSIQFTLFVTHLKAGSDDDNKKKRKNSTEQLMNYIDSCGAGNYFFMGDFNFYNSDEEAYQKLINADNSSITFSDPLEQLGDWDNNSAFAFLHTQSTHKNNEDCYSYGGMDSRFDFILISKSIKDHSQKIGYVDDSYVTIGQDGQHFNKDINEGDNKSAPDSLIEALYKMSDHLPICLDLSCDTDIPFSIQENDKSSLRIFPNPTHNILNIRAKSFIRDVCIYNIMGEILLKREANIKDCTIGIQNLPRGVYFIKVKTDKQRIIQKIIKQ